MQTNATPPGAVTPKAHRPGKSTIKRPTVVQLLDRAKVTSHTRELDLSFAADLTPRVLSVLCESMPQLRRLIARDAGLTQLPHQVGQLAHLRELDLSHNMLTHLPDAVGDLAELQHLNISRNAIVALPATLHNLQNLRLLNANYNAMTDLPAGFGALTALRVLRMGANKLRVLPAVLAELADLRLIQLAYNALDQVPELLWHLPELKVVDISYNRIATWQNSQRLPKTLSTLNILGNPLTEFPPSLTLAQSHEIKIIGLPRSGTEVTRTRTVQGTLPQTTSLSGGDAMTLNVSQDLTGILFAGLGDFSVQGHPPTDPASTQLPEDPTHPDGAPINKRR